MNNRWTFLVIYYQPTEHEIVNVGRLVSPAKVPSNSKALLQRHMYMKREEKWQPQFSCGMNGDELGMGKGGNQNVSRMDFIIHVVVVVDAAAACF